MAKLKGNPVDDLVKNALLEDKEAPTLPARQSGTHSGTVRTFWKLLSTSTSAATPVCLFAVRKTFLAGR